MNEFPNCWDIKKCGRQKGGEKVAELGECVASIEGLGHSCWAIAGTLCGGVVQGTVAQKEGNCVNCDVHKDYNRVAGKKGMEIKNLFPRENEKYQCLLMDVYNKKRQKTIF